MLSWDHGRINGAFAEGNVVQNLSIPGGSTVACVYISMNAKRSSSTYTNNGNIYPRSLVFNYLIKY